MQDLTFAERLLSWFDQHGRKDLPWQQDINPYRVWVSEIMLQQTQVATVIPYYQRFMQRFPDIQALATAEIDAVLHHWSGLGYYARGRNLHKAAQQICELHQGVFPQNYDDVVALPGIGRSTAGAILAIAAGQRYAILDGNVKRVLARHFAADGWPGNKAIAEQLWMHAEALTPDQRIADYTQAIMDLGAMICTRSKPACGQCPLQTSCQAYAQQRTHELPSSKPRRKLPERQITMLLITDAAGDILLERRPPTGIWGGLLGFPELATDADPQQWAAEYIGQIDIIESWATMRHTFSHFHLDITPVIAQLISQKPQIMDDQRWLWYNCQTSIGGLAAPVQKLMNHLQNLRGEINGANRPMRQTG